MKLKDLIKNIEIDESFLYDEKIEIKGITSSDKDLANNMFVCIKGEKFDTHNLIYKTQEFIDVYFVEEINTEIPKCQIKVKSTKEILLKLYINFNNIDINKIKIIGITGTNGKTTTTYYTKYLLERLGFKVAVLGTSGCYIGDENYVSNLTTPSPKEFASLLKIMIDKKVAYLVMEVSAHAVKQFRIMGIPFCVGAFTNISIDHLDDFNNIYEYAYYKFKFLTQTKKIVLNIDDKFGKNFYNTNDITISTKCKNATFLYKLYRNNIFCLQFEGKKYQHFSNVITNFNAFNLSLAISIIYALKLNWFEVFPYINQMPQVDGRYKLLHFDKKLICIDYAHTPDAINKVLKDLRKLSKDLIVLFGASGYRDMKKRVLMGKIANKYANFIILTADNPRYENVMQICEQISKRITKPYVFIENRAKAIEYACKIAQAYSVVALLGKGNEQFQDINAVEVFHSDEVIVKRIFNKG